MWLNSIYGHHIENLNKYELEVVAVRETYALLSNLTTVSYNITKRIHSTYVDANISNFVH